MPESRPTKLSAVRSAVRSARALPEMRASVSPAATGVPSATSISSATMGSSRRKAIPASGRPATTPASRVTMRALAVRAGGNRGLGGHITSADVFSQGAMHYFNVEDGSYLDAR